MLITIYGINNIGKTTQAKKLVERLIAEGYEAEYVKYPVYDVEPSGPFINEVLRGGKEISERELQMWFAVNRHQFEPQLKKWLDGGKIVVAEDYTGTGIAWGTVKGADTKWLEVVNEGLVKEDVALMLDGERFVGAMEEGHVHETNFDFMQRSKEVHAMLAEKYGWNKVEVLSGDINGTAERLWNAVRLHLPAKSV